MMMMMMMTMKKKRKQENKKSEKKGWELAVLCWTFIQAMGQQGRGALSARVCRIAPIQGLKGGGHPKTIKLRTEANGPFLPPFRSPCLPSKCSALLCSLGVCPFTLFSPWAKGPIQS